MESDFVLSELEKLYKVKNLENCENKFIRDGIINLELFSKQQKKILFIAKEHNFLADQDYTGHENGYIDWCNEHVHLQFAHRISEWAYGIQNNFPEYLGEISYETKHAALKSIAFMNVKKSSGGAKANADVIFKYIDESRELLLMQINAIAPTHIVCCFRYDEYPTRLFNIEMYRTSSNTFGYGRWNGVDIINFYHPSSRKNKRTLYLQLSAAFNFINSI
jgi:hypothetical protein